MGKDAPVIQQGYRFAFEPTSGQEEFLISCCGASRFWFNQGLALVKQRLDRLRAGEEVRVPWSYKSLCSEFAPLKDVVCPWRAEVVVGSMQAGLEQLGNALQNFSKGRRSGRRVGFPRFRAKGRSRESVIFQRPRIVDSRQVVLDRRLGRLRTKESMRKLLRLLERDPRARILRSTIRRSTRGWAISFTVERSPKRRQARRPRAVVGVDLGLTRLATLSTGEMMANTRPLQEELAKLRRLQRRFERQRRTSNPGNYLQAGQIKPGPRRWVKSKRGLRTEQRIQRLHERVANLRREQAHQLTTSLTREYGVIGVETLQVKNLLANRRLALQISDAGWGEVLRQLAYKSGWSQGSMLVAVDRFYPSSRTCSACGAVKAKLSLAERLFSCEVCGYKKDRDLNAALNLAQVAKQQARSEVRDAYVARTGRETQNARGGQVRPEPWLGPSSLKREASLEASQRREALAPAGR